jgi:ABC-type nickel/cobalt efflux system permease component RcnA
VESVELVIADGAGNLPIVRISSKMRLDAAPGRLEYEDHNYDGRAGWKEIVIAANHTRLKSASQGSLDRSQALTAYPPDPMVAPPQDLRAEFVWEGDTRPAAPVIHAIAQPASRPAPPAATVTDQNAPAGAVVKNDFLSRLLHRKEIPLSMILAALIAAFSLAAAHALTPGHGKTIVAAYLVGSRGTLRHAAFLGAMVTFTHTVSVFALGLATLFLFRFIVPEKITEILGVISGLLIAVIGGVMLWKRIAGERHRHHHHHHHHHDHEHDHQHHHDQGHSHDHEHHHHGPEGHAHVPEGEITWGSLTALAVSGGLIPCESALVLLLSSIALGRVALGLVLLVSFSLGLAGVLMGIGAMVLYGKRLLPERARNAGGSSLSWTPVASAAIVVVLGVIMTGVSLGWLPARWLIG